MKETKRKIMEMLLKEIKEKQALKICIIDISIPEIPQKELWKSARTLTDRSIVFNGKELPFPDNTRVHSMPKHKNRITTLQPAMSTPYFALSCRNEEGNSKTNSITHHLMVFMCRMKMKNGSEK